MIQTYSQYDLSFMLDTALACFHKFNFSFVLVHVDGSEEGDDFLSLVSPFVLQGFGPLFLPQVSLQFLTDTALPFTLVNQCLT